MTIYKCKECGSTDIRMLFWCNPNTMTIDFMFLIFLYAFK